MASMEKYLTEDFPKKLTINIGARHSFKNYNRLVVWLDQESNYYRSIYTSHNFESYLKHNIKAGIIDIIKRYRNDNFTGGNLVDELSEYIEKEYKTKGIIASKSKEGKWLLSQHKKNPSLTKGSFDYFQNKIKGTSNHSIAERNGNFSAYLFDVGIEPNFDFEKEQYESYFEELSNEKDEIVKELLEIREENKKLNEQLEKQSSEWETQFTSQKADIEEKFDLEFNRHKVKMESSENFYDKKLAVKNAVVYWSKKAKGHLRNSWVFGIITGLLMIFSLIGVIRFGNYIISLDINDVNGIGRKILTESGALQLWVYGFFIVSMTLVIWFIRLLVKVFLSNVHLLSDANERETMIKTYLALEREERTLKPADRDLILPSIFRTSTNGIIKEDSTPSSPINIFAKKASE